MTCLALVGVLALFAAQTSGQTQDRPTRDLLTEADFESAWENERGSPKDVDITTGVLRFGKGAAIRTKPRYWDFLLTFDARVLLAPATFEIVVRNHRSWDERKRPGVAYEIRVDVDDNQAYEGRLTVRGGNGASFPIESLSRSIAKSAEWQHYRVDCTGQVLTLSVNDAKVAEFTSLQALSGNVGFGNRRGAVEFRNVRITDTSLHLGTFDDAVVRMAAHSDDKSMEPPTLQSEQKPAYTERALQAGIRGTVLLQCVVTADGMPDQIQVVQSLGTRWGLDEEAIKALEAWRFRPGRINGKPVPVVVTVEMNFTIR